jgi:cytoplasmic iron level regulating protein YaaA (DUF328/UPF0246 family)
MYKILVITSCTSKKAFNPSNLLAIDDFKDEELLKERIEELAEYKTKAIDMYKGLQHTNIVEGVEQLRAISNVIVDVAIISAGYGLLLENDIIVPYEVTFNNMNSKQLKEWGSYLNIAQDVNQLIKDYDIILVALGNKYLKVLDLPLNRNIFLFETKQEDAKLYSYPLVGLKGYQFKLLCNYICNNPMVLDSIYRNPQLIKNILKNRNN